MMGGAEVAVKERPILFSGEMVRALLSGQKTVTRRVVKPQPLHRAVHGVAGLTIGMDPADDGAVWYDADGINPGRPFRSRYGAPLDRLWVRETWAKAPAGVLTRDDPGSHIYAADYPPLTKTGFGPWRPSIFMRRPACRVVLEITGVSVERVQWITEASARAEGVMTLPDAAKQDAARSAAARGANECSARDYFRHLWDDINAPRGYGWDANPWVWVVEFRVLPAEGQHP